MGSWLWEVGIRAEGGRGAGGVLGNFKNPSESENKLQTCLKSLKQR